MDVTDGQQKAGPTRAPLAHLLPPLVAGIAGAAVAPAPGWAVPAAGMAAAAAVLFAGKGSPKAAWHATFWPAATLAAWAYASARSHPDPSPSALSLPARETRVDLRLSRVFEPRDDWGRCSGIATVLGSDT